MPASLKPPSLLTQLLWRLKYPTSTIRAKGKLSIHPSAKISKSIIRIDKTSSLEVAEGCNLNGIKLRISNGSHVRLEPYSELYRSSEIQRGAYIINNGSLTLGHHSSIRAARVWIRFGGKCEIGCYVNMNGGSEIRADEYVSIGDYCMLSYNLRIWDTNTHNIYSAEKRAELKRIHFPDSGYEYEKPKTAPVIIGCGCWIGERASILKGCRIGDDVIVGYNTMLSNKKIDPHTIVVQKPELVYMEKSKSESV